MAVRQKHGRPLQGFSRNAYVRLLTFLTFCVISVGISLFGIIHLMDNRSSSHRPERKLAAEAGETPMQDRLKAAQILWTGSKEAEKLRLGLVRPEVVSWSPRVIHLHGFLSILECDALIAMGRPTLVKSTVVDSATGRSIGSESRTSSGMFLSEGQRRTPLVRAIEERISTFTMTPHENGEMLQILRMPVSCFCCLSGCFRYEPGQYYKPHPDFFQDEVNLRRGGQRVATVLMYLEAAEEGGETHFPQAGTVKCRCGGREVQGLCVRPQKGDAVLFWSAKLTGEIDPASLHESCPVLKGEKWSCTKWIRQWEFH